MALYTVPCKSTTVKCALDNYDHFHENLRILMTHFVRAHAHGDVQKNIIGFS